MNEFIALYKNGKYKLLGTESEVFKKRDKIQFLLIPTSTVLKGTTYTMIEGKDIRRVEEQDVEITTLTSIEIDGYQETKSHYKFHIKDLTSAFNVYPFFKIFSQISIFTSQHVGSTPILSQALIHQYPGSTAYPYRLDRDKFEVGYHDLLIKIILDDNHWYRLDNYDEVPEDFTAIFIFNLYAHDGYLFTGNQYNELVGSRFYLELSRMEKHDYPTEGETLMQVEIEDRVFGYNKAHSNFTLDVVELLLTAPQIIMFLTEILQEELYMLMIWNDRTINQFIRPGDKHTKYSIYNLLFNN